ncbi:Protein of unknown function [Lactobacillus acidophilus DSM 20079 = JCM 1132 = NBRC 13951 = CIP 76.13]|nr:Protein of unknown function [Lactobacillus acidophilus DSM 20079 = JCM 1132 = NBRC 13951 = CIP 76.13]
MLIGFGILAIVCGL